MKKGEKDVNNFLMRGLVTAILVISVLTMFTAVASAAEQLYVNETGWYRAGGAFNASGTPIQHAIDNATAGDSIYVYNGSYTENVNVNKAHLTLQGEGRDVVTVAAESAGDHVFDVTKDYVNISGFTATGATGGVGINLDGIYYCNISDNNVYNNRWGIYLYEVEHSALTSNTANSNTYGIFLMEWCVYNTLTNNTANSNTDCGIYLCDTEDNDITCNWVAHNEQSGFHSDGGNTDNNISQNNIMFNGVHQGGDIYHWNFYNYGDDPEDAKHNYWGATTNETIDASIRDGDPGEGGGGEVTFYPFETTPPPCAPIPEVATIILFSIGLLTLAGYLRVKRKD